MSLCLLLGVHNGVSAAPHAREWLHFRLGRHDQGDNGVLSLELPGKHFWGTLRAVYHWACCCRRDKFCSWLHRHNFGRFPKHEYLISLWLIDFNGIYSFIFYNGVSESRIWPEATIVLHWQTEPVKCAGANPLQGGFKFCDTQTHSYRSRFLIFQDH